MHFSCLSFLNMFREQTPNSWHGLLHDVATRACANSGNLDLLIEDIIQLKLFIIRPQSCKFKGGHMQRLSQGMLLFLGPNYLISWGCVCHI